MATKKDIKIAWEKAKTIRGKYPETWRRDSKGKKIRKGSYGTKGKFGWELDHIKPKSKGGPDKPKNIQALHWKENLTKSNK